MRALLLAAVLFLCAVPAAQAHGSGPARVVPVTAGPYRLLVSFYDDPPRTNRSLPYSVDPAPGMALGGGRLQLTATAQPAQRVNAVPVRASVGAHDEVPGGVSGQARLPVAGAWSLHLDIQGPLGPAQADVPLQVAPPPAIPVWLGWLVGLLPVWGLLGFILVQTCSAWRAGGLRLED